MKDTWGVGKKLYYKRERNEGMCGENMLVVFKSCLGTAVRETSYSKEGVQQHSIPVFVTTKLPQIYTLSRSSKVYDVRMYLSSGWRRDTNSRTSLPSSPWR